MISNHESLTWQEKYTISTDPQQRSVRLPLIKGTTLDEPVCRSVVLSVMCSIMIDGRIWRREPFSKLRSRLVSCAHLLATTIKYDVRE